MQEARMKILQHTPIFGGIRTEILQLLLGSCPVVSVPPNEFFFRENDQADSMFVLEAGKAAVLKSWRGQDHFLRTLNKGDCFGDPGSAALHITDAKDGPSLTAVHEFSHAISDYQDAFITDLYVDGPEAFNRKVGRPIPDTFATYNGERFVSDKLRDGLGYPTIWNSYPSELQNTRVPAVMDAYPHASEPHTCEHDRITKRFILDVVAAKIGRTGNDTA